MPIDVFRRLRDAVRRKRPKKWRTNNWFFLHDNAPAHRQLLVKDFLAKNNLTTSLQCLAEVYRCTRRLFWRKCIWNNCTPLYFSKRKCFRENFEATIYVCVVCVCVCVCVCLFGLSGCLYICKYKSCDVTGLDPVSCPHPPPSTHVLLNRSLYNRTHANNIQ